jgi:UPF0755 protein
MKKKIKILSGLLFLGAVGVGGVVFYYGFDPNLLKKISFYLDLANPSVRIVKVQEGLRKEEIAEIVGDKLGWNEQEKNDFINVHLTLNTRNREGFYFPKTYLIPKDDGPLEASNMMFDEFSNQVEKVSKPKSKKIVNQNTVVTMASIIQREADGKNDMRLISGIIWNRVFKGMKLQMDATLQYAKGNEEDGWWGRVKPEDKKINSSYNTYIHPGLPPSAIANPGLDAISAVYNPQKTDCLFYLHDKSGRIHCSPTYEGHKKNISLYY